MISSNPRDTSLHPSPLQDVRLIRLFSEAGYTPSADWRASQGTTPIKNLAMPASCLVGLFFSRKALSNSFLGILSGYQIFEIESGTSESNCE